LQTWLLLLVLCATLLTREWQHQKTVTALLDRLMSKAGYEPLTEETSTNAEPSTVTKEVKSKAQLLAQAGAVHFRVPQSDIEIR